jgi:DNA-binding NtrC family response regulator
MPPKNILIVDDDPTIRGLCASVLDSHGFHSIVAVNGREGTDVYRERHAEICLVLSDISMPIMNGIEMVRNIVRMQSRAKVILMSDQRMAGILPDDVKKYCGVIDKPFTAEQLLECVRRCLKYDEDQRLSSTAV